MVVIDRQPLKWWLVVVKTMIVGGLLMVLME
jgi:hypothetical protein